MRSEEVRWVRELSDNVQKSNIFFVRLVERKFKHILLPDMLLLIYLQ